MARALDLYRRAWLGVSLVSTAELAARAAAAGLRLTAERDLGAEFEVVARNYKGRRAPLPGGPYS